MEPLLCYDEAVICFNVDTNTVEINWLEVKDTESFKLVLTELLDFIKAFGATAVLLDIRKIEIFSPVQTIWFMKEILPRVIVAGLEKFAFIIDNKDVLKREYVKNIQKNIENDIIVYFECKQKEDVWMKDMVWF